jgi:hypothetical protein
MLRVLEVQTVVAQLTDSDSSSLPVASLTSPHHKIRIVLKNEYS